MGLFEKLKTDKLTSFDWDKSQNHESNQDNLPPTEYYTSRTRQGLEEQLETDKLTSFDWNKSQNHDSNQSNLPVGDITITPPIPELGDRGKEVDTQYKKLGGNNSLRGDGLGFDEPFIIRDIGDSYAHTGIWAIDLPLQVQRTAEDVIRIAKFAASPRGVIFGLKQALLQKQNTRKETRTYNPLRQMLSAAPLVHAERHNKTFLNPLGTPPRYQDEVKNSETIDATNVSNVKGDGLASIGENIANAFGFGGDGMDGTISAKSMDLGTGRVKSSKAAGSGPKSPSRGMYSVGTSNTLQVPYGGQYGKLEYASGTNGNKLPKDFIKFKIRDAVNGKWLIFPAHLGTITDTVTPEYSTERYIGRPDSVHIYTGTNRSVGFDFKVAAFTKQEIPIIQEKMNYLMGLGYPTFKPMFDGDGEGRPVSPYIYLTIGDLFKNTPGYFDNITITMEENATWELDEGHQIPMFFSVSVNFVYIGKYLPTTLSKHYEVPWLEDSGFGKGKYQTFGKNDPTAGSPDASKRPDIGNTATRPGWAIGLK